MKETHKGWKRLGIALLSLLLVFAFTGLILMSTFAVYMKKGIDPTLDMELLIDHQGRTTKLYYENADGVLEEMTEERLHGTENRIWISLDRIPEPVKNAFIAIEDHRFYDHNGVDFHRTGGAVLQFLSMGKKIYGGSTITQQLVKNLTGDNQVTVKRKLTEMMRALALEKEVSKDDILELYLNTVYLSEGCYGIETASETYFDKSASELTLVEGAALAAILQYPTRYDPIKHPEENRKRRNDVLFRMHELGMLEDEVYRTAVHTDTELHPHRDTESSKKHSWFTETVIEDIIADLAKTYKITKTAAANMVYRGGLTIHTTMDRKMQDIVSAYYENPGNFPKSKEGARANSACVIINPENGHILAVAGDVGEKKSDRIYNLATKQLRSPGSVIKPISVYAPAMEKDLITWSTVFDDIPLHFEKTKNGYSPWPKNNPRIYSGLTTVKDAVRKSTNTISVQVLQKLGVSSSYTFLKKVGISTLVERESGKNGTVLSDMASAPLALGAMTRGVSLREMTGAYTMLANGKGYHSKPISYTVVYDKNGKILLQNETKMKKILSEDTVDIMTKLLSTVVKNGTASGMHLSKSVPVAGKTGTSNANTDRWFIGYTPELLCGIWYGHKDAHDIGTHKRNPAVTVFDGLMSTVYKNNAASFSLDTSKEFPESDNVISALYCKDSGEKPGYACSHDLRGHRIELGYFKKGTEPHENCHNHILIPYDRETGTVANDTCPKENQISVGFIHGVNRSFPCQIQITDAEFIYRHLPFGAAPTLDPGKAFFQEFYEKNSYIGISGVKQAHNRYCTGHEKEEPIPSETEGGKETAETTEKMETSEETTRKPPMEKEETNAKKPSKLVPWW